MTLNRGQSSLLHRAARWTVAVSVLALLAAPAVARVHHNDSWARQQFAKAERMREALNGRPAGERTRREYQRAIDAYRRVYFGSPTSSKADPSVVATAELMVEMGRRFDDDKILRGAVEEYRFLRKEYPGSKYRFEALFTIGEVYKDDLNDSEEARKTFEDFLHRYPRNRLAADARAAVNEIDEAAAAEKERAAHKGKTGTSQKEVTGGASNGSSGAASNMVSSGASKEDLKTPTRTERGSGTRPDSNAGEERRSELPRVTSVRHWSTPDYTRVAIDVEQEVKFYSQRIANPDRIFFDLRDTRLASTLVGKTFDVDDGFLKKIRVAEFKPGRTRIVLEVDDLASYDAFLLPNPYRLIIDVHGKQSRATVLAKTHGSGDVETQQVGTEELSDAATEHKGQQKLLEKEHAIVAKAEAVNVDAASQDDSVASKQEETAKVDEAARNLEASRAKESAKQASGGSGGSGVVKTTVAVKGTNRRIPKTIVEPDDDPPATLTNSEEENKQAADGDKRHGENAIAHRGKPADKTAADPPNDSTTANGDTDRTVEEAKLSRPDEVSAMANRRNSAATLSAASPSPSGTRAGSHRRKSGVSSSSSASSSATTDSADLETREAQPTAAGDRSLTRALGLKIGKIVIDAGHGGHDTGTIGPNGLAEKDVVLDVAKRLGRLLETRLGARVVYTRRDDTFIPLETRTAIANRAQADLFISIHANSSRDEDARGVETYYLNFTSSPDALEVAARENAVSEKSIHELQDLVKKIALKEKIEESREFAGDVQESLYGGLALSNAGIRNRGVKKAPFIVLIGANMPSILAEISFVSNPADERKLGTAEHRQRIAEALYRGVARYAGGLSGVKVASRSEKTVGSSAGVP